MDRPMHDEFYEARIEMEHKLRRPLTPVERNIVNNALHDKDRKTEETLLAVGIGVLLGGFFL